MRAALDGSINSIAPDHWIDRAISCVTVFGGTGFLGRRVVHQLRDSGATVRIASRRPGQADDANVKQVRADAHDERSVEAAAVGADGWSTRSACTSSTEAKHSIRCTWKRMRWQSNDSLQRNRRPD
jgi:hypothetical protein